MWVWVIVAVILTGGPTDIRWMQANEHWPTRRACLDSLAEMGELPHGWFGMGCMAKPIEMPSLEDR